MGKKIPVNPAFVDFCKKHSEEYTYKQFAGIAHEQFGMQVVNKIFIDNLFRKHGIKNNRCHRGKLSGSICIKANGRKEHRRHFKYIKINHKWILLHRYLLEQQGYNLTSEDVVVFLDGNFMNCSLDNLYVTTKAIVLRAKHKGYLASKNNPQIVRAGLLLSELEGKLQSLKEIKNQRR